MGWPDAPQATYSTQFKQKARFGKSDYELTLTLNGKFEYLPRLRRSPNSDSWQPLFLCLTPKGIEDGAYSTVSIFTASDDPKSWQNIVEIEGWNKDGYTGISSMVFVMKDGSEKVMNKKNNNEGNRQVPTIRQRCIVHYSAHIVIDPNNPVVEIVINSKEHEKAREAKPKPLKPYLLNSEYSELPKEIRAGYKPIGGVRYLEGNSIYTFAVTGDPEGQRHQSFIRQERYVTVIWVLPEITIEKSFTTDLKHENMLYMFERHEYNFMPEYVELHRRHIVASDGVVKAKEMVAAEKELQGFGNAPKVVFSDPKAYAMSVINLLSPKLMFEDKEAIAAQIVGWLVPKPAVNSRKTKSRKTAA